MTYLLEYLRDRHKKLIVNIMKLVFLHIKHKKNAYGHGADTYNSTSQAQRCYHYTALSKFFGR